MSFNEISTVSQYLPFVVGLFILLKYGLDKPSRIFFAVLILWTISEIINPIFAGNKWNNHIVFNTHWVFGTVLLLFFFKEASKMRSAIIYLIGTAFFIYCVICLGFFGSIWKWNMAIVYLSSFLIICLSAYSLVVMVNEAMSGLFRQPVFWICATLLFYFTVALVSFSLFPQAAVSSPADWKNFWAIHSTVNIISNLFYTYAFLCRVWTN